MRVKYITETEVLFNEDIALDVKDEDIKKLTQFDNRGINSITIEFIDGVKTGEAHSIDRIKPEWVKQMIFKIKE